ncbi:MAG: ribulose-phosphate 3-epimerase [Phycisphaeraceae bacterium]|nr:ribulose-phosphate 3-epimerase [Phycisphaeraceae bacterium]
MRNLFTNPRRLPLVAPSILSADFAHMGEECASVLSPVAGGEAVVDEGAADLLHLDVMDGHFVPNLTMGPDMCRGLRRAFPSAFLDVHLMVTDPWPHAQAFIAAGANHVTFHVEAVPEDRLGEVAAGIRELGASVGLAVNPPTTIDHALDHLEEFDLFLVMSVNPGFSGQAFMPEVLKKTRALADEVLPTQRIQMDGGISPANIRLVLDAGCDVVVAASAVFGRPAAERPGLIRALRGR